jgi:hypothetical protein
MPQKWLSQLKYNLIPPLQSSRNKAVEYFTKRDLLSEEVEPIGGVWQFPEVQKVLQKQLPDGSWKHTGKQTVAYPQYHHSLVATWKTFRLLVERYELNKTLEPAKKAAEFFFSCQTGQGDIRGMLANQYATYYTGSMLAILIKTGYETDPRVEKGLRWLLSMRQNDGGWSIPILTHYFDAKTMYRLTGLFAEPIEPDRTQPFSHIATDMVLRSFAVHSQYRYSKEVHKAADLLKSRFFQPDAYTSYHDAHYWVRFAFWWPNIITSLDSLSLMGYSKDDMDIKKGLDWLRENQLPDGLWKLDYSKGAKEKVNDTSEKLWLALKVARLFKRFYG